MNQELERLRQCPTREHSIINATMQSFTTDVTSAMAHTVPIDKIFQTAISDLVTIFQSATTTTELPLLSTEFYPKCHRILVECTKNATVAPIIITTVLLANFSTTIFPKITQRTQMSDMFSSTLPSTVDYDYPIANSTLTTEWNEDNFTSSFAMSTTNDFMENITDFELTSTQLPEDDYSNEYYDTSGDGQQNRSRRNANEPNNPYYDYYDDDLVASTEPPEFTDSTDFDRNFTEILSSTIDTFLENISYSSTLDYSNETQVSEAWTEYVTTTYSDSSFSSTESTTELTTPQLDDEPEYDLAQEIDADGKCYSTVCVTVTTEPDEMTETTESTFEDENLQMHETEMSFFTSSTLPPPTIDDIHPNVSHANVSAAQMCVPFRRNHADNITGIPPEYVGRELSETIKKMKEKDQLELRDLCWETLFGQELVKLTVLDLIFTIITTLFMDFFRALFVRFMNKFWCWDLEKRWPKVMQFNNFKFNLPHLTY